MCTVLSRQIRGFFKCLFLFCRISVCIKVEFLLEKCFAWLMILLKREKEICNIPLLANKYIWILFIIYGESLSVFHTCNGHGC